MTRLRIAQLCADRGIAPNATKGAALHLRDLAAALDRRGNSVTTLAARTGGNWPVPLEQLDTADLARQIADCSTVYERYSLGHLNGLRAARNRGARFVLEVNAPLVEEATRHRPATVTASDFHAERVLLREADAVVAVSEPLRRWCASIRGTDTDTYAISNGFEAARFAAAADPNPVKALVVFLGHPKPWHGADRLPALITHLVRAGVDAHVRLIGGGPGADAVAALARERGVIDRLEITGEVSPERAAQLMRDATIAVAPYPAQEPFYFCPLKLIDYMAAGLAVVATDQGDIARLVGEAAILVPPDDEVAFSAAVCALLGDDARRRALAEAARARAFSCLTWDHVAARLEPVLA